MTLARSRGALLVCFLVLSFNAAAVTVGYLHSGGGSNYVATPLTLVDYQHPAKEAGTLTTVTVFWTSAPSNTTCNQALKIKFLRRSSGFTTAVFAERGPFNVKNGINTFTLDPPVPVVQSDLIGAVQLPVNCGGIVVSNGPVRNTFGLHQSDVTGTTGNLQVGNSSIPNIRASSEAAVVHGYIPVVGSLAGNFGSFFRTGLQLTSRSSYPTDLTLVYHPAGAVAKSNDPFINIQLPANATANFDDILVAMGQSGLGTMDLVLNSGMPPDVTARVYNDAGTAGTSGFTVEMVTPFDVMRPLDVTSVAVPSSLTNFRLNVGIRTFDKDVTLNVGSWAPTGAFVGSNSITVPANTFRQFSAAEVLGGVAMNAGGSLRFQSSSASGTCFIYGAVTDNRTNDGSYRLGVTY
ncbi:MAG TPA: hypothetical protein VF608_00235 [Thermoanaerobaculia bacterium]